MAGSFIGGLLDRAVLVAGTLAGGCVPGFLVQYRQRVGGRLDQVTADLAPFREIAARFHDGSLDALVAHHLASTDPTFHAEGAAIQSMMDAESRLQAMYEALQGGVWQQLLHFVPHHDPQIVRATWEAWLPAFTLDGQSLTLALVIGGAVWLLVVLVVRLGAGVLRRLR